MKEITYEDAEKLLLKNLEKQKEKNRDTIVRHSKAVSEFLFLVSKQLNKFHPELNIDCEKMRIVGLLHDVGKNGIDKDFLHAENGCKFLKKEGLVEIGNIVRTHTIAKESAEAEEIQGFEPTTLEEKLLTYADCHIKQNYMHFNERYDDIIERSKNDRRRYESLIKARSRIQKIIDEIDRMLDNNELIHEIEFCLKLWGEKGGCAFGRKTECEKCGAPYVLWKLISGEVLHGEKMKRLTLGDWKKKMEAR